MAEQWQFIDTGEGDPAWNMAFDDVVLRRAEAMNTAVLRFYGWSEPAATFGYFQRHSEVEAMTELRPLIRRSAGGGLVPHDADWTYSISVPATHDWHAMRAAESYRRAHEWLQRAFEAAGVATELADCCVAEGPGRCFAGAEKFDLLFRGRKIAGAAQRRVKFGLLIQGSVQPGDVGVGRAAWREAMQQVADVEWSEFQRDDEFDSEVEALVRSKYGAAEFIRRR